jgi:hypothetical protein
MACDMGNSLGITGLALILCLNQLKGIDLYIILYLILGISIYVLGRATDKLLFIEIYHYMLAVIFGLIPIISSNKEILNWHLLFIIFTLGTRKAFNGCIVRKAENKDAITHNSFTKKFNWDMIFPMLGVASTLKLYFYH